jgi:hypothetical protein
MRSIHTLITTALASKLEVNCTAQLRFRTCIHTPCAPSHTTPDLQLTPVARGVLEQRE